MRLFAIDPAEGWAADINDEAATIDGNAEQIGVAIEILSSGDFQPLMLSSDVLYSVTAYATIIRNDVMTTVKTHTLELRGNCYLLSEWGPELASSVDEDPPTLLPPLLDKDFTFNQGGSTYRLAITQLDMNQFFKPDGSPDRNQTFVAAAAEITGPGVALSCETAKVTHTFESFPLL